MRVATPEALTALLRVRVTGGSDRFLDVHSARIEGAPSVEEVDEEAPWPPRPPWRWKGDEPFPPEPEDRD